MAEDHAARVSAEFDRLHKRSAGAVRLLQHSPAGLQQRMERLEAELRTPMPKIVHQARKSAPAASEQSKSRRGGRASSRGRAARGGRARATRGRGSRARMAAAGEASGSDSSDTDESGTARLETPAARRKASATKTSPASSLKTERCACCGDTLERRAIGGCCSVDCWRTMRQNSPKPQLEVTPKLSRPSSHSAKQILNSRKRKRAQSDEGVVSNAESTHRLTDAKGRRLLAPAEEAAPRKATERSTLNKTKGNVSKTRLQPVKVKAKWLDLPLGLLQWGFTEQLHCRSRNGAWTVSADSPNLMSPVRASGPAAHRWLRAAATQGAATQVSAVERRIAAAAKIARDEFTGPLPFLPRTVRRRLRLMSVRSPKQSRIAQQTKAQRHADRLAAAGICQASVLHQNITKPSTVPNISRLSAVSTASPSVDDVPSQKAQQQPQPRDRQHQEHHQHQEHQEHQHQLQSQINDLQGAADTVLRPKSVHNSNRDGNQIVSAISTSKGAMDTHIDRATDQINEHDTSIDELLEKPVPRSALWQRTASLSTEPRAVHAQPQSAGQTPDASTAAARSWLDNRRPQSMAPTAPAAAAASAAAAAAAAAATTAPARAPLPSEPQPVQLSTISGQASSRPTPAPVVAPGRTIPSSSESLSTAEVADESSFDFGDTLDEGLALSTGGLGLMSVVGLAEPVAGIPQSTHAHQATSTHNPLQPNPNSGDGPLHRVLPPPSNGVHAASG